MSGLEKALNQLNAVRVADMPVGKSLGFILSISVVGILNGLLARALPKAMEWPIIPAFGIAYLQSLPFVRKFIGDAGAEMIAIAALYSGIDMQVARMTGVSLSQTVVNLVSRPFRAIAPPAVVPATSVVSRPAGKIGQPGEVGVGNRRGLTDLESGVRLNMLS